MCVLGVLFENCNKEKRNYHSYIPKIHLYQTYYNIFDIYQSSTQSWHKVPITNSLVVVCNCWCHNGNLVFYNRRSFVKKWHVVSLPNKRRHVIPCTVQRCPMKNKRSFGIKMTCHQIYLIKNNMSSHLPEDDDIYVRQCHFTGT